MQPQPAAAIISLVFTSYVEEQILCHFVNLISFLGNKKAAKAFCWRLLSPPAFVALKFWLIVAQKTKYFKI